MTERCDYISDVRDEEQCFNLPGHIGMHFDDSLLMFTPEPGFARKVLLAYEDDHTCNEQHGRTYLQWVEMAMADAREEGRAEKEAAIEVHATAAKMAERARWEDKELDE